MAKKIELPKQEEEKVNAVTLHSEKVEIIFALKGEAVYITCRKKGQKPDKLVITAHQWMEINKAMFNPENKSPEDLLKKPKTKNKKKTPKQ